METLFYYMKGQPGDVNLAGTDLYVLSTIRLLHNPPPFLPVWYVERIIYT
jgi:hypothetical protein